MHFDRQQVRRDGVDVDVDVDDVSRPVDDEQVLQRQGLRRMVLLVRQRQHQRRRVGKILDTKDHRQRQVVAARVEDAAEQRHQQQRQRSCETSQQQQPESGNVSRSTKRSMLMLIGHPLENENLES